MRNNKKNFFIVCGIIILCLIAANVVIIGLSQSDNPREIVKPKDSPPAGRSVDRSREDQKFEQAYDKRNAEITP